VRRQSDWWRHGMREDGEGKAKGIRAGEEEEGRKKNVIRWSAKEGGV
jgi:hypothetical protein